MTRDLPRPVWSQERLTSRCWGPPFSNDGSGIGVEGMFSVIVPVYNGSEFLRRAVASVRAQTYQNFEVIVVDDGSTDDSLEIAKRLASEDSRVGLYAIDNSGGPARPRNHAIQRSRGEFIAFLDQDDWWLPEKLERQLTRFHEGDFAVVYSDAIYLDPMSPDDGALVTELPAHRDRFGHVPGRLPEGQVQRHLIMGNFAGQLTVAVRADWARKVGRLDESAVGVDCYEYLLRIALAGGSFGAIREPLAVHDRGSLSRDQETASAYSLQFFKDFARRFPEHREQWNWRMREYEDVLIDARIEQVRDGSRSLRQLFASFYEVLWLHPRGSQLWLITKALLPAAMRRRLRALARPTRAALGLTRSWDFRRRRSPDRSVSREPGDGSAAGRTSSR